jgi:hypothetical protein
VTPGTRREWRRFGKFAVKQIVGGAVIQMFDSTEYAIRSEESARDLEEAAMVLRMLVREERLMRGDMDGEPTGVLR